MKTLIYIFNVFIFISFSFNLSANNSCENYENGNLSLNKLQKDFLTTPDTILERISKFDPCLLFRNMAQRILDEKKNESHILHSNLGKYYALIIGNNKYKHWSKLKTAVNDADEISNILNKKYGFTVTTLRNGNHKNIMNALFKIRKQMSSSDNLLIYYAGHGQLDEEENIGYWIPIDGDLELRSNWVSSNYVLAQIKATKAKHVLVITDSCFSGILHRGNQKIFTTKDISKLAKKKTRISITSGGNEPVMDSGNEGHSVFAYSFIKNLNEKNKIFFSTNLFFDIRKYVLNHDHADQTPELSVLTKYGHDGGDFIFVPN